MPRDLPMGEGNLRQLRAIFEHMADETWYALDADTTDLARAWWDEENEATFKVGLPSHSTRPALVYAVEAARAICRDNLDLARELLSLCREELRVEWMRRLAAPGVDDIDG